MNPIDLNNLQPREIIPGYVIIIPPNVPHSGKPLTDRRIIDVFYPKHHEYRNN